MIKIRLHGQGSEIDQAVKVLSKTFKVLMESSPYKDRGTSEYSRIYLDVELKKERKKKDETLSKKTEPKLSLRGN